MVGGREGWRASRLGRDRQLTGDSKCWVTERARCKTNMETRNKADTENISSPEVLPELGTQRPAGARKWVLLTPT